MNHGSVSQWRRRLRLEVEGRGEDGWRQTAQPGGTAREDGWRQTVQPGGTAGR